MITGTKEYLDDLARRYKCPDHDNPLTVAWVAQEDSYALRCGAGHFPEEIVPNPSLTNLWKQGEELPEAIKSNIEKGMAKRQAKAGGRGELALYHGIPPTDLGTGALVPKEVLQALVNYATDYGLDPRRGHVCLMYGKPYITLDGYLWHANRTKVPYQLRSRPLTDDERIGYQLEDGDHGWITEIMLPATNQSFCGIGIVTKAEMTEESKGKPGQLRSPVVAKHPWQLAQKRAEWQALRRAFPIGSETSPSDSPLRKE